MALTDPGAGLPTRAQRHLARTAQWQAQYEALTPTQKTNQAYNAVTDLFKEACLLAAAKRISGLETDAEAEAWLKTKINTLALLNNLKVLDDRCPPPTDWTPEPDEQGGTIRKILVIRGEAFANGIRQLLPVLPRIGSVPPITWGPMPQGTATVKGISGTCFAASHPFHEAHLHLLEAIVTAEGALSRFDLVDSLEEIDWEGSELV
jgi:hypothetical protein